MARELRLAGRLKAPESAKRLHEALPGAEGESGYGIRAGERKAELAALAAKYDLKAALNKKPGDFAALIRETKDLLNR